MSFRNRLVLMMVASLGLGAATCRGRTKTVETPANTGDSGTSTTDAGAKPAPSGVYSCSVQIDEDAPVLGECRISPTQELEMAVDGLALAMALVPAECVFRTIPTRRRFTRGSLARLRKDNSLRPYPASLNPATATAAALQHVNDVVGQQATRYERSKDDSRP